MQGGNIWAGKKKILIHSFHVLFHVVDVGCFVPDVDVGCYVPCCGSWMFCFMLWMLIVLFHVANLVPGYLRCRGSVYLEYATCQLEENTVFNIQSLQN